MHGAARQSGPFSRTGRRPRTESPPYQRVASLYLSHANVLQAAQILGEIMQTRAWDRPQHKTRAGVT